MLERQSPPPRVPRAKALSSQPRGRRQPLEAQAGELLHPSLPPHLGFGADAHSDDHPWGDPIFPSKQIKSQGASAQGREAAAHTEQVYVHLPLA